VGERKKKGAQIGSGGERIPFKQGGREGMPLKKKSFRATRDHSKKGEKDT